MDNDLRILLADDHEMVRKGLRTVIESRANWVVCAEAANGREAVELARSKHPAVAVVDLTMPELNGLDATRTIVRECRGTEVLILTMHDSEQLIHSVLAAGARGYVLKSDAGTVLVEAIESLARHEPFFTSKVSDLLLQSYLTPGQAPGDGSARLTTREREIIQLVAEGHSSKEIAGILGISVKTADTHRTNLMRKLGIHSVSEVVRYAIRNNMIEP